MTIANVSRIVDDHLGARGGQLAIVDGDWRFTFCELAQTVDRTASALAKLRVTRGDRVCLLAQNSSNYVTALLALSKLGAISVPLNIRWVPPEVSYALDQCQPAILLTDEVNAARAQAAVNDASVSPPILPLYGPESLAELSATVSDPPLAHTDVGFEEVHRILYTSGTTSRPKGAITTYGNVAWNHRAMALDGFLRAGDRVLVAYPLFHVSGLECPGVFSTLCVGGTVVMLDGADADTVLNTLSEQRIHGGVLLSPLFEQVLNADRSYDLSALRWVITGGVTPSAMEQFRRELPGVRLIELYAMTEATGAMAILDEAHMVEKAGRCGRQVPNTELQIVDENGVPVLAGQTGHVIVRGPKISPGYWADPEATRASFREGWFDTGDLGEIDEDGYFAYRGRVKEMIKCGGENVAMAEIERVVSEHPAVKAVCVVRIPHGKWGEAPKAYVLCESGVETTGEELEQHCRAMLAGYKVPREWEFVDELPFNHSGKVVRRVLQDREDARQGG